MTRKNRQWRLASRPTGLLQASNFEWTSEPVPSPEEGQFLVRNQMLSLDPTNRRWISKSGSYMAPVEIGDVMRGTAIGIVETSRHPKFPEGSWVQGLFGWQDYALSNGRGVSILPELPGLPPSAYFGLLGHIGLTAYFGLLDIGRPQAGETLVVNAAAGAVGSLVGQIGKIKGCRVVGITGSAGKCRWITEELGFDAAINYKEEDVRQGLKKHCPNGIDVVFENVGGAILDAELSLINIGARIALCGLISQYNATQPVPGPYYFANLIIKRARVEGFLVTDYLSRADEAIPQLIAWHREGRLKYQVEEVQGLEHAPQAFNRLFSGEKQGKLILQIAG